MGDRAYDAQVLIVRDTQYPLAAPPIISPDYCTWQYAVPVERLNPEACLEAAFPSRQ